MKSTPTEALAALTILARKYGERVTDDQETAVVWHASGLGQFAADVLGQAALDYSATFPPSAPEFVEHCRGVERERRAAEHAALRAGPSPLAEQRITKEQSLSRIAAIKALRQYCVENPDRTVEDVIAFGRVYADETDIGVGGGESLSTCRGCDGSGMVVENVADKSRGFKRAVWEGGKVVGFDIGHYETPTARPCSSCNRDGFWLWEHGHREAGHVCSICTLLHKGDRSGLDAAMAGEDLVTQGQRAAGARPAPDQF